MEIRRGGALLEGIALESTRWRVAVARRGGIIYVATASVPTSSARALPFVRALHMSLVENPTELAWSAEVMEGAAHPSEELPPPTRKGVGSNVMLLLSANGLPTAAIYGLTQWLPLPPSTFQAAVFALQVIVFTAYLSLVPRLSGIDRLFRFNGAFKKALWQMSHPKASLAEQPTWHWRSSFVGWVLALGLVATITMFVPLAGFMTVLVRIALTPFALAVAYEVQRLMTALGHGTAMRVLFAPLVFLDRFCTHEPDAEMLEVANVCVKKLQALETI
jgi:uncharacterized protein YqhQ